MQFYLFFVIFFNYRSHNNIPLACLKLDCNWSVANKEDAAILSKLHGTIAIKRFISVHLRNVKIEVNYPFAA